MAFLLLAGIVKEFKCICKWTLWFSRLLDWGSQIIPCEVTTLRHLTVKKHTVGGQLQVTKGWRPWGCSASLQIFEGGSVFDLSAFYTRKPGNISDDHAIRLSWGRQSSSCQPQTCCALLTQGFYVGEKPGFRSPRQLKKGLRNKVSDWSGNQVAGSNCNVCTGTSGCRVCGAAECAEAFVVWEQEVSAAQRKGAPEKVGEGAVSA